MFVTNGADGRSLGMLGGLAGWTVLLKNYIRRL
jgi:hypothetical protein